MEKRKAVSELTQAIVRIGCSEELQRSAGAIAECLYAQLNAMAQLLQATPPQTVTEGTLAFAEPPTQAADKEADSVNDFVDRMYKLYPTRCPKRNASLGKGRADKVKIKRLLKTYTQEEIEQVIRSEVDSNYGVNYMKNFSTFLNNFPEPIKEVEPVGATATIGTQRNEVIIGGVRYQ